MNITFNGFLTETTQENIFFNAQFSDSEDFIIEITPELTIVSFPNGSYFFGSVEFQNDFYDWVKIKPSAFYLRMDGDSIILEIDVPPKDTMFRLESGSEGCWWAGFQTQNSRYLKRIQMSSHSD